MERESTETSASPCVKQSQWEDCCITQELNQLLQDSVEGEMGCGVGGRFKGEETYVALWLIHGDVWQKHTVAQHCKAIIYSN